MTVRILSNLDERETSCHKCRIRIGYNVDDIELCLNLNGNQIKVIICPSCNGQIQVFNKGV